MVNAGDRNLVRVDGNALAGLLADVFTGDVTTMIAVCAQCHDASPLACAIVEMDDVGCIVLCRGCRHTMFTALRDDDGIRVVVAALSELRTPLA